jgi:sulfite exporter TauE/SafE
VTLGAALAAAAGAGLVGTVHCAAMCGPLAAAGVAPGARAAAGYFGGRLLSYGAVGALLGFIGEHALCKLPMASVQLGAAVLVALALAARGVALVRPRGLVKLGRRPPRRLLGRLAAILPRRGLGLGLATGILPCGMLIPAWLLAAATASAAGGAAVMVVFSVASAPGLVAIALGARAVRGLFSRVPPLAIASAFWLLALYVAARPLLGAVHSH